MLLVRVQLRPEWVEQLNRQSTEKYRKNCLVYVGVAKLVRHQTDNLEIVGPSPTPSTTLHSWFHQLTWLNRPGPAMAMEIPYRGRSVMVTRQLWELESRFESDVFYHVTRGCHVQTPLFCCCFKDLYSKKLYNQKMTFKDRYSLNANESIRQPKQTAYGGGLLLKFVGLVFAGLAQLGEHMPYKHRVGGSSPSLRTIDTYSKLFIRRLWVQIPQKLHEAFRRYRFTRLTENQFISIMCLEIASA